MTEIPELSPVVSICRRCDCMIPDGPYEVCSTCTNKMMASLKRMIDQRHEFRMTLRDEFAMAALAGLAVNLELPNSEVVSNAYAIADAMLAEREKGGEA